MRSLSFALLATALLSSAAALANNDQVTQGPTPAWANPSDLLPVPSDASGLYFVRRQDTIIHLDAKGQENYTNQHIKVLHPQALQLGNVGMVWNPAVGAPVVHALNIHRDGTVIDVLKDSEFEILRREDQLEQAKLEGLLTAILRVPDLRVGDELEMAFTVRAEDPTLRSDSSGFLMMAGQTLPGRYRLGLNWIEGQEPQLRITPDFEAYVRRDSRAIDVLLDNPPTITPPKNAPPRYNWQRIIEYSDFASWGTISKQFSGLFAKAATLSASSPVKTEAARIKATHESDLARAQAALELVQKQVRYIYVGLNGGNFTPATADETWQRRYGDCKGKTVLLLALLAEMGIKAEAVLANNVGGDDGYDQRLPNPGLFDHVLVRATIEGRAYWLDGTLPDVANARTQPTMPYRWVLPLTGNGNSLEAVPFTTFALPQEMGIYEIDARAGFDKPGQVVQTTVKRGIMGMAEYVQMSALTPDQILTSFRNALVGSPQWDAVDSVTYRYDRDSQASIVSIKGSGPIDWDDDGDGQYSLALPGGGFSPPERRQRSTDQDSAAPYYAESDYSCYTTTIRLPGETKTKNWGFNTVFDTKIFGRLYYRMMERNNDGTIRMVRGSRVDQPEISPETARRDNERLSRFDNSKANITYDPDQVMTPQGHFSKVPATFEIDWTAPNVPCLPSDVMTGG